MVRLNPHLRQNYSIFMRNFKQNQHKLSNNHVQFSIETSFVNLNPLARNPGSAPASTIYFILFTWASPYGTHMEPGCTVHMGPIRVPTWDPYGSHIDCLLGFSNARFLRSLSVPGGRSLFFSACVGSSPASTFHPQKYQEFQAPKKFFYPSLRIYENIRVTPPPPPECSCIVIPGAPVSQIKLA